MLRASNNICRWKHVLLTRYTYVNTLRRITPLDFDWTAPLPMPDLARKLQGPWAGLAQAAPGQAPEGAVMARQLASKSLSRHQDKGEAADRRDRLMARMSRRIIKNRSA